MEDADDPSSKDEDSAPEEDQHYYGALQTHLEKLLPFINQIINNSERLNVVPTSLSNLRRVYDLVGSKRLQVHWLKMCKNIFYDLHKMHGTQLNYYLPPDFKTSWMQETKFNDKVNNLSINVKCTSNKSNQKQNSESKLSNKIPGTSYENIVNNQMDCLEVLTPNIENTIDKNFANVKIGESSCSKNVVNNSMLAKNYPPELLDSYIRLNKIVGISVNAAIAKFNECEIEKTKNSYTDRDLQIKRSMTNNKSKKDYSCPEINVEDITVNIPSNFNKNGLDSESEQNSILMDHTDQNKPKKQNKYSKEKEFEKNVKDASDNLSDDVWSLKRKTRRNWMNKAKIYKTLKLNNSKPKFKKDIAAKSCKILEFGECSKNLDNVSIPNLKDVSGQIEIGHNMISSPSKEQSGVVHFTTTEILCKSREENIVSSDGVYSTTDINPNIKEKNLIEMFKNPKFMNIISILLQDQNNLEKFKKLLDVSDDNINDSLKKKDILFKEQLEIRETKKVKKKKNLNKKSSKESKNEILNIILDDNNLNQAENIGKTNKKNSHFNELNKGNTNSGNINGHLSTDQHKLKSKECYRHFEILKDKSNPESKELNNCTAKLDKHIKRSEICNSDSSSKDKQTNNKPIIVEKTREIKSKKPFLGPLSVKLARQKMEIELKNHRNKREIKNQLDFETKKVRRGSKSIDGFDKKGKLKSETLTRSINNDEPNVLICPFQNSKPCDDETNCNKPVEQNSNISTLVVNKPKIKKGRLSELELLHADISKMFDCESVYASNIRQCRIYKQIDYVNTNEDMSKKKRTSNIEQLVTKDSKNVFVRSVRKPKKTVKESTIKLNTKEQFVKKSMANKTLPLVVNTTALNKKSNKQPSIIVEKTREIKSKKPFLGPLSVKLARQKMEIELKNHRNKREIKNQLDFETKKVRRGSKSIDGLDKKGKLKSETLTRSINNDEPNVLICPFQNSKPCDDETNCNKPVEQNSNISTLVVNKPKIKKGRLSEIELLHADISKMFDCESVYASNIRQCRIYKQIDYVNTNEDMSKKKRTSNIEQLVTKDSKNDFVRSVRKPKKNVKKLTIKLNTKEQFVKKSMANKTLPPVVKTTVLNKMSNKQPSIINKSLPELSSYENLLDLTIDTNSPELTINENLPESNIDENLPESVYDKKHVLVHQSVFHTNISKIHIVQLDDRACENPKEFKEFVLPYKSKVVKTVKQKITQEQPNDTNDFVSSLMIQQNTSLKRKHCSTIERDELDIKIIELIPDDSLNTEIYPQFIQPNMRYECSIPLCTFTGKTDDILKEHISILHPTYHYYKCPHCLPQCIISNAVEQNQIGFHLMHHGSNLYCCQYCDYIDFNRVEMRTHMKNTHLLDITSSVQSNIIVIRQFMLEDDSIDRYTKNDIIANVVMTHKVCWTSSSPSKKKNIAHETKVLVLYRTLLG